MSSKPNWACPACGMYSSRKASIKRHVTRFHGSGPIVSYIDYLAGRKDGFYPFGTPPFVSANSREPDFTELGTSAFYEGLWTEAGREAFKKGKT
jgi:hypothetical protein